MNGTKKDKKDKIVCAGYGYVGKAMVKMLGTHYDICVYDPAYNSKDSVEGITFVNYLENLNQVNAVLGVVCVPTPMKSDKSCDISLVEQTVELLDTPVILIKSTIEPGTTERLKQKTGKKICFSPEYTGESTYWSPFPMDKEMKACPFVIIGGDKPDADYVFDILAPILGPTKQYRHTSATVAEIAKYWENSYFAAKVIFANEMYEICKAFKVSFWETRDIWGLDPRFSLMHTAVFKNKRGFSGKCFPKDINALVQASKRVGYEPKLLEEVINSNERFLRMNRNKGEK